MGFFLKSLFSRVQWSLAFSNKTLKRASRLARANANTIRRMLLLGLLIHGKEASHHQFLLRRITTLSLYLFGLLALLAKLAADEKAGLLKEEDLLRLQYFLEEAGEARKKNRRFFDSREEQLSTPLAKTPVQ
jgi:acyl-CoA dehydrogenase family member 9